MSLLRSTRLAYSSLRATSARGFASSAIRRDHFLDASDAEFAKRCVETTSDKPVLVDFYATWCQPCRVLTPLLKEVTEPGSGYDLMTINVDDHPDLAGQFKISSIPAVIAFKNGQVKNKFIGFRPKGDLQKFLATLDN